MRRFANLFLILFLVDGGVSFIDALLSISLHVELVSGIRQSIAYLVIILAVPLYISLGIDRRLPKLIFLPLTVFVFWAASAMWPLPALLGRDSWLLSASAMQVLLGLFAIGCLRRANGQSLLLTKEMFSPPCFSLRNTLLFFAGNLLLLPLALVFFGLSSASYYLDKQTAGFMRLSPAGIHMTERVYRLDQKIIRLVGMSHIGEEAYYKDIADSVNGEHTIVLAEGVTDEDHLLKHRLDYGKLGSLLGLVSQEKMKLDGRTKELEDIETPDWEEVGRRTPEILRADIDFNQFDPRTVEFLNVLGKTLSGGAGPENGLMAYNAWIDEHMTPELLQTLWNDILYKRNRVVIATMKKALEKGDTIVIPWGVMHMPAIEEAVIEKGFLLVENRERLSLDFKKIPYARLLQELWKDERTGIPHK